MKKIPDKIKYLMLLLCLLPMLGGMMWYSDLPSRLPVHFDFYGQPDLFFNKPAALFGLPLFLFGLEWILLMLFDQDLMRENQPLVLILVILGSVPAIGAVFYLMIITANFEKEGNVASIFWLLSAFLFILIGNYLPKCKPNKYIGIRLPWTLNNREIWMKTHRLAGFSYLIGGFIILVSLSFGCFSISLFILIFATLLPVGYSIYLAEGSAKKDHFF